MVSISKKTGARVGLVASVAVVGLVLAGCATAGGNGDSGSGGGIIIGTTDKVTKLDPAGSFDNGSLMLQTQVFGLLMDSPV